MKKRIALTLTVLAAAFGLVSIDGYTPTAVPAMSMVWADGPDTGWDTCGFFHDAGVPSPRPGVFCKATWQTSPFGSKIHVSQETAGHRYLELIRETGSTWPELVTLFGQ
jgi:hypothetical protein